MSYFKFRTNLDSYQRVIWNYQLPFVPRKGEYIYVPLDFKSYCEMRHIPDRLEVSSVSYYMNSVEIYLSYNEVDFKIYNSDEMKKKYGQLLNR